VDEFPAVGASMQKLRKQGISFKSINSNQIERKYLATEKIILVAYFFALQNGDYLAILF